jgi:hypothetical protein
MTEEKPKQIQAVELVKSLFEYIQGNLGLMRFSIDILEPINGKDQTESDKWKVVCSFYETLSSQGPTVYEAEVNLTDKTVKVNKKGKGDKVEETKKYSLVSE